MFAVNLPTPGPSLEKGGERRYYANSKIYSILPVQSAPLPAGREGSGVGMIHLKPLFGVDSRFKF